ncbi:hypothetical protein NIT60_01460 [Mammaliicoccus sciuri]|nr:hypothetical protein NIT60_01460 [Mammaliicoccus sciuri]
MGHEKSSDINGDYWLYIFTRRFNRKSADRYYFLIIGLAMVLLGVIKEPSSKT